MNQPIGSKKPLTALKQVPHWVQKGWLVNYHSVLRGPVTHPDMKVTSDPYLLGGHTPCVMLEGYSGCVAISNLSRPGGSPGRQKDSNETN